MYRFGEVSSNNCLKQIPSNQKYLILQNRFPLDNSYAFPKAILHECQRSCKLQYLYSSFVYDMSDDQVHCIDCAMFLSTEKQRSFGSFATRYKRVAKTLHKKQRLNIGNQYHNNATYLAPGTMDKFEEPHNIIPHQIDETLKERQIKYPRIVEALDRIFYLIEKQGISYRGTQETAANRDTL